MRENRPYGSEGGEDRPILPDPYRWPRAKNHPTHPADSDV